MWNCFVVQCLDAFLLNQEEKKITNQVERFWVSSHSCIFFWVMCFAQQRSMLLIELIRKEGILCRKKERWREREQVIGKVNERSVTKRTAVMGLCAV